MPVDPELLEILVCPADHGELEQVELDDEVRARLVRRYQEELKDEEAVVEMGLRCTVCGRTYPVVSGIPVMLIEEALQEEVTG
ncbi:MAG TPA: hypothetical protein ENK19_10700 [Acidobacteria bacterium]|nr:hypothetical protein [Acidobacteriota bacterium]